MLSKLSEVENRKSLKTMGEIGKDVRELTPQRILGLDSLKSGFFPEKYNCSVIGTVV